MIRVGEVEMEEEFSECLWTGHPGSTLAVRKWSECHEGEVVVVEVEGVADVVKLPPQHCYPASHHLGDPAPAHIFSDGSSYCT